MANIYQEIWDADQTGNGVRPIFDNQSLDTAAAAHGYVKVNSRIHSEATDPNLRVLTEASIPYRKNRTYELCRALFENYALDEQARETETPEEREEVHSFLQAVVDTAPMQVAREYVEQATGTLITKERWYTTLLELWFRRFSQGGDPELSGFEHIIVGEQEGPKVQGYHFWYKYYLDDGFATAIDGSRGRFPGLKDDRIVYLRSVADDDQVGFPESVTISYRWFAPDYDAQQVRPLTKAVGGFFVGCSVEGLMALGTVRAHMGGRAPKVAVINGARYDLKVYRSPDNKNLRTFYPVFLGPAGGVSSRTETTTESTQPQIVQGAVKILAAMVNPIGHDVGGETITLINMSSTNLPLTGWRLIDKQGNAYQISDVILGGGAATTIVLPKNSIQLSNQGGEIRLVNTLNQTVHRVTYSKEQANRQGETILF